MKPPGCPPKTVQSHQVYAIWAGVTYWNAGIGQATSGERSQYSDPECFIRLVEWLPLTDQFYQGYYGKLPTERCLRPDIFWPTGFTEPTDKLDPASAGATAGLAVKGPRPMDPDLVKPVWTEAEQKSVLEYRNLHPLPRREYDYWPVSVALLQQPFVPFESAGDRKDYMRALDQRDNYLERSQRPTRRQNNSEVRKMDEHLWRKLLLDEHRKQAMNGFRPARPGERAWDRDLHQLATKLGTCFIVFCRRQVVDGAEGLHDVIEAWLYVPGFGYWSMHEYYGMPYFE